MAVRRGTATPSKVFRGTVPVKKIYRGNTLVWSASDYPLSGTWGPVSIGFFQTVDIFTHTMSESGNFTFNFTANSTDVVLTSRRNGSAVSGSNTWTANLVQGDTIAVQAASSGGGTYSGTWSIVKN